MSITEEVAQTGRTYSPQDFARLIWILLEGHAENVAEATVSLARKMAMPERQLANVRHGALLHDVGKLEIPEEILYKEGPLSDEDWTAMRRHPALALDVLSGVPELQSALNIPYCHHEKWNGTGYPRGLKGEDIPLEARIFSVVDVWDALTSERLYRRAWPIDKVIDYIRSRTGTDFDPEVVNLFLAEYEDIPALHERMGPPPKPLRKIGF
ncbi:MAG TPA: HD-GYP domain-containing protein [Actinomycetota bacterium]|jgi:HD-GYP domain-containing protein (c-di-GMP phosphodiesterase class II)|nr:HD-GYP domain-containing protein [Actinomycetota bacterium]